MVYPEDPSLCALGMITSLGNESAIGEMQARWMTQMWKTNGLEVSQMEKGVREKMNQVAALKPFVSMFVRYVPYMDDLAKDLGVEVKPKLRSNVFDPHLYYALNFEAVVPAQYRISGLDSSTTAREMVVSRL